jgi:hypothetical protein
LAIRSSIDPPVTGAPASVPALICSKQGDIVAGSRISNLDSLNLIEASRISNLDSLNLIEVYEREQEPGRKIMLTRIFGDRPFVAVAQLLVLSLLVGLALTAIGIDPLHLAGSLQRVMHRAANLRSATLHWGWHCFLLGAMLVIPGWMLVRLSALR